MNRIPKPRLPQTRTLIALLLLACALPVLAWAPLGHRLVGDLAERHLTPAAKAEVAKLLAGEREPTLAGVANWADELRNTDPDRFKRTSRWHYVKLTGPECAYEPAKECKDGSCVIAAIEAQLAILRDRSQPLDARRDALKFVVHLVGDVHQPFHASNRPDAGGNQYQISLRTKLKPEAYAQKNYVDGVMGTNLHSMWDYYVLGETGMHPRAFADELAKRPWPPVATTDGNPTQWAQESCRLIDDWGTYPQGHKLDASYGEAMRPLAERRVLQAADRLALLLNEALDPAAAAEKSAEKN
ncbi:S1/P1 nuclease [Solilutibacter silvestris]|uniref:S1/P1 nuclease n=1 Tax=Solilutibacter silvestris TaxID=1645665 RepID=UPI003D357984